MVVWRNVWVRVHVRGGIVTSDNLSTNRQVIYRKPFYDYLYGNVNDCRKVENPRPGGRHL